MAKYYVDNSRSDGDGSFSSPWNNIAGHIGALRAGDTMYVRGNVGSERVYTEHKIVPSAGGRKGSPIVLRPYANEQVQIRTNARDRMIQFTGVDWWEVRDMTFNAEDNPLHAIYIKDSGNLLFERLTLENGRRVGFYFSSGDDVTIQKCRITNFFVANDKDAMGIVTKSVTGLLIQDCTIYDIYGDCIIVEKRGDPGDPDPDVTIKNCHLYTTVGKCSENAVDVKEGNVTISGCQMHGFRHCDATCGGSSGDGAAVNFHNDCIGGTVEDCEIYDSAIGVISALNANDRVVTVRRNVFRDMVDDPARVSAVLKQYGIGTVKFHNNTVDNSASPSLFWMNHAGSDLDAKNNIFDSTGSIDERKGTLTADYNLWHDPRERKAGAHDVVDEEPMFVGGGDYRLRTGSPAIDAGTDVGLPFKEPAPDLGAYEYESGPASGKIARCIEELKAIASQLETCVSAIDTCVSELETCL
jgi:polygalacturonase